MYGSPAHRHFPADSRTYPAPHHSCHADSYLHSGTHDYTDTDAHTSPSVYCRTGSDGGPQPYSQPYLDSHTGTYRDTSANSDTTAHLDTNTNLATYGYIYPSAYEHAPTNPDPYTHASHQVRVAIPALRPL